MSGGGMTSRVSVRPRNEQGTYKTPPQQLIAMHTALSLPVYVCMCVCLRICAGTHVISATHTALFPCVCVYVCVCAYRYAQTHTSSL